VGGVEGDVWIAQQLAASHGEDLRRLASPSPHLEPSRARWGHTLSRRLGGLLIRAGQRLVASGADADRELARTPHLTT
jgi:hypothetical protein